MKFLIVVDMQNDFITGSLGTKEAEAILPKVLEKIRTYRPEQIFVTQDTHPDNYLETNEGRHLPVAHCIAGSQGHALNPLVAEALEGVPADHFICKPTFGSTLLVEKLKTAVGTETPEIELVGLCTGREFRRSKLRMASAVFGSLSARRTVTLQPSFAAAWAITNPSPPLLPFPQTTSSLPGYGNCFCSSA